MAKKAGIEPGDTVLVNQDGYYKGVEVEVEEVLESPEGFAYIVNLPAGYYNRMVEKSNGEFALPWHGESARATFAEDELLHLKHEDATALKEDAVEIADHPSLFGGGS